MNTKVEEALRILDCDRIDAITKRKEYLGGKHLNALNDASLQARTTLAAHIAQQDATIARLTELAEVADGIISVCGGDAWERECTADGRSEYDRLRAELFPQPEPVSYWNPYVAQATPCPTPCELCGSILKTAEGRRQHLRDKHSVSWEATKHASALTQEQVK